MEHIGTVNKSTRGLRHLDDRQLLAAVTKGDRDAFGEIHQRHSQKLMKFAHRMTGDHQAAEEVTNDTLLVIWRSSDSFRERAKVSTWMFGIAYRLAMKKRQDLARRQRDLCIDECLIKDTRDTAADIIHRHDISAALDRLKPELRTVVELTFFQGYIYAEISERLGCPVGTVKTRMMTAKQQLRGMLSEAQKPVPMLKAA